MGDPERLCVEDPAPHEHRHPASTSSALVQRRVHVYDEAVPQASILLGVGQLRGPTITGCSALVEACPQDLGPQGKPSLAGAPGWGSAARL